MSVVIYHHNDPDGQCAAAIIVDKIRYNNEFICKELDYKDSVPLDLVRSNDKVYIVDFSFQPDVMHKLADRTHDIYWIDHHKTAEAYVDQYPACVREHMFCNFKEKALSGCELTWLHIHTPASHKPDIVKYIGDYDKWALKCDPVTTQVFEGFKMRPELANPTHKDWALLLDIHNPMCSQLVNDMAKMGEHGIIYRDAFCDVIRKDFGYETKIDGHKAYAMNLFKLGSRQFGDLFKKYDVCIAYIHDGNKFTVSLYSEKPTIECGDIAKKFGGGGHKGAAGFVCQELPFKK